MFEQIGVVELDVHQMTKIQAKALIDSRLKKAGKDVFRLRIIHGYHGGTALKNMIRKEYKGHAKVLRIEYGMNQGETDLVLKDFF